MSLQRFPECFDLEPVDYSTSTFQLKIEKALFISFEKSPILPPINNLIILIWGNHFHFPLLSSSLQLFSRFYEYLINSLKPELKKAD